MPFNVTHVESINKNKLIGTKNKLMDAGGKKSGGFGQKKVRGLSTTTLFSRRFQFVQLYQCMLLPTLELTILKSC